MYHFAHTACAAALELLLSGEPINAATAFEIGLVQGIASQGELVSRALDRARELVGKR